MLSEFNSGRVCSKNSLSEMKERERTRGRDDRAKHCALIRLCGRNFWQEIRLLSFVGYDKVCWAFILPPQDDEDEAEEEEEPLYHDFEGV